LALSRIVRLRRFAGGFGKRVCGGAFGLGFNGVTTTAASADGAARAAVSWKEGFDAASSSTVVEFSSILPSVGTDDFAVVLAVVRWSDLDGGITEVSPSLSLQWNLVIFKPRPTEENDLLDTMKRRSNLRSQRAQLLLK
jgi:hypothetical protein